jgi:hypothetical protein
MAPGTAHVTPLPRRKISIQNNMDECCKHWLLRFSLSCKSNYLLVQPKLRTYLNNKFQFR